jgi:hypothetical protein
MHVTTVRGACLWLRGMCVPCGLRDMIVILLVLLVACSCCNRGVLASRSVVLSHILCSAEHNTFVCTGTLPHTGKPGTQLLHRRCTGFESRLHILCSAERNTFVCTGTLPHTGKPGTQLLQLGGHPHEDLDSAEGGCHTSVSLEDGDGSSGVGVAAAAAVSAAVARAWATAASHQQQRSGRNGGGGASGGGGAAADVSMRRSNKAGFKLIASINRGE